MSPFEYDIEPFVDNVGSDLITWDLDGDVFTDETSVGGDYRGVVWGTERPELLITETLAYHARMTEDDANIDDVYDDDPNDGVDKDEDFDQKKRPEGGLFIELYNPNGGNVYNPATDSWEVAVADPICSTSIPGRSLGTAGPR